MSAANATTTIAFKVQLQRRDREPVFHRFSGSYNFSELSTVISHLWGERPKHLVLDYTDDEGDQCRVTSEAEWEECVRIFQGSNIPVLRLTGKRAKDEKRGNKRCQVDESSSESEQEIDLDDTMTVIAEEHPITEAPRILNDCLLEQVASAPSPSVTSPARSVDEQPLVEKTTEIKDFSVESSVDSLLDEALSEMVSGKLVPLSSSASDEEEVRVSDCEWDADSAADDLVTEINQDSLPRAISPNLATPDVSVDPQVLTLMSIFPDLSADEADLALRRAEGNMSRAVNARLSSN